MAEQFSITLGSCGRGTWNSQDSGKTWGREQRKCFMPPESPIVRSLNVHPNEPHTLYAGLTNGLFRSKEGGRTKSGWEPISATQHDMNIWSMAIDPNDPDTIFVGTSPASILRSRDGGHRFEALPIPSVLSWCDTGTIRVRQIAIDPGNSKNVFAGLEVDGVRRSLDGGDTWENVEGSWGANMDLHQIEIVNDHGATKVFCTFNNDIHVSEDMGESWNAMGIREAMRGTATPYLHWSTLHADDPNTIFLAMGNGAVGDTGALYRTKNAGDTWEKCDIPGRPNSTMYHVETTPIDPDLVSACTCNGQVYISEDGGDQWREVDRVFGELHCISLQSSTGLPTSTEIRD